MKTAVIYARYSSDNQSEQSIEGQLRVCEEYAQRNNILIIDNYIDRAMTGTNDHRPEFQRMIKDSHKKEWDYVIVYKLDRFSRDKYETVIHRKTLRDNGVKLLSAMENIPDTPEGIILEGLLESMNQYFSAELSQKTKRGMRETRLKGHFQGGYLIYGYKLDNKKIIIDEDEANVVKYIFQQYSIGVFARDIVKALHSKGISNRGKPFAYSTLYRMLRVEKYTGIYHHGDETYENMYPPIIEKELFENVQQRLALVHYGRRSLTVNYLLSRKVFCGYCGNTIVGEYGTSKCGKKIYYYKCSGIKRLHNNCPKVTMPKEALENFVIKQILSELNKPEIMAKLVDHLIMIQPKDNDGNPAIKLLEREQKQAQNSLSNLLKAAEQGVINKTTNQRMQELEEQLTIIEKRLIIEKHKIQTQISREQILKYYKSALNQKSEQLINILIKKIIVYNDKMIITFNTPPNSSPDANQGCFYSAKLQYGTSKQSIAKSKIITTQYVVS